MAFICQSKQLLTEIIGIRIHHNFWKDWDEPFEKFINKLIIVFFFFNSCLQFHSFLLIPAHCISVLDEIVEVTIMTFVHIFPICAFLCTATTDTTPTFVTRYTIFPVKGWIICQIFIQIKGILGIRNLSFWRNSRNTGALMVLAVLVRWIFIITLVGGDSGI